MSQILFVLRIIAKKTLRDFWEIHNDVEETLKSWYNEFEKSKFENFNQLKNEYPSASILQDNRVVFNIKGNHYRLIVKINFDFQLCWIRFIGTHAQYNKINANII